MSLTFNTAQFQADLRKAAQITSRTIPEFLNARAYFIIKRALDATPVADRAKIEKLGLRTVSEKINSKGRKRRKFAFDVEPAIAFYLAVTGKRKGMNPGYVGKQFPNREALAKAARKMLSGRLKAIGFLKSGWLVPLRAFSRWGSGSSRVADYSQKGKRKGEAIVAKEGWNPTATFINNVTPLDSITGAVRTATHGLQEAALNRAFTEEAAELESHLRKKLGDEFRRQGATVK
jgi:hypothetical protein